MYKCSPCLLIILYVLKDFQKQRYLFFPYYIQRHSFTIRIVLLLLKQFWILTELWCSFCTCECRSPVMNNIRLLKWVVHVWHMHVCVGLYGFVCMFVHLPMCAHIGKCTCMCVFVNFMFCLSRLTRKSHWSVRIGSRGIHVPETSNSTLFREIFKQVLVLYNSNNQQSNEN